MRMKGSWLTRILGILAAIGVIISGLIAILDSDPATVIDMEEVLGAIVALGLWKVREEKVDSENAGAKRNWKEPGL